MAVTRHLERPTRGFAVEGVGGPGRTSPLIWPCSDWGLPCHARYRARGGLLPHRFTLTCLAAGGLFSVALSVAFRRPGVTWQFALGARTFLGPKGPRPSRSALQI